MVSQILRVDFANPQSPEIAYGGRYTIVLGRHAQVDKKFAMLSGVLATLKEGDIGVINLSDGQTARFSPN